MNLADYIVKFIKEKDIDIIFVLQGGMIVRLIDAIGRNGTTRIINMHHEQALAMAADAYGRIKNKPCMVFVTSGPGATNLLTGMGCSYFDGVPVIFIAGQVNSLEDKSKWNPGIRQLGFQETDIVNISGEITKKSYKVNNVKEFPDILESAYRISTAGRMGPVLIDIPIDKQSEEVY